MPYVPRRFAPISGPAMPPRAPLVEQPKRQSSSGLPLVQTLSIRDYTVDPDKVYEQLFGKDSRRNDRGMVPTRRGS